MRKNKPFQRWLFCGIVKPKVVESIRHLFQQDSILFADTWRAYMTYQKKKFDLYKIHSKTTGHVIKGLYHIQNVNGYHMVPFS